MDEEKVAKIFMAIFLILIMIAFCYVAIISGECDSDKPNEEKRGKVIVPIQLDKNNHMFISL
jgi:hypothetical protein